MHRVKKNKMHWCLCLTTHVHAHEVTEEQNALSDVRSRQLTNVHTVTEEERNTLSKILYCYMTALFVTVETAMIVTIHTDRIIKEISEKTSVSYVLTLQQFFGIYMNYIYIYIYVNTFMGGSSGRCLTIHALYIYSMYIPYTLKAHDAFCPLSLNADVRTTSHQIYVWEHFNILKNTLASSGWRIKIN